MMWKTATILAAAAGLAVSHPAQAGNRLIEANRAVEVAASALTVQPTQEWNRLGVSLGRSTEIWTLDGDALNRLTFYGGIADQRPLFREADRRNRPLPKFTSTMLLTDIATLLENSYRVGRGASLFAVDRMEPSDVAGRSGVRFTYSFVEGDEVRRTGEAYGAIVEGRLYLITFEAPALHYFDLGVESARQVVRTARLGRQR